MNKLRSWVISAFIVTVPLCYLPNFNRQSQENYFQYASMIVAASFIGNVWLGSFLAWNVVLYIINGATVGNSQVLNVLFGCLIFTFSRYFFKKNKFEDLYKPILIVVCVSLVFMAMQLWNVGWMFRPIDSGGRPLDGAFNDPVGFFGIKEASGTFLTLAWPIVANLNPILAALMIVPIKLSQSSSVYLAFGSVVLFYTYFLHKKIFRVLIFAMPIIASIYVIGDLKTDPKTFTSRFPVWHSSVEMALRRPIGYGPDSYRHFTPHKNFKFVGDNFYNHIILTRDGDVAKLQYYSPSHDTAKIKELNSNVHNTKLAKGEIDEWDTPHNMFVNLFLQYGLPGLIMFCGLFRECYNRFRFSMKDKELITIVSCLLVYIITGLTHFPLELARTAFFAPILLGAYFAKTDEI